MVALAAAERMGCGGGPAVAHGGAWSRSPIGASPYSPRADRPLGMLRTIGRVCPRPKSLGERLDRRAGAHQVPVAIGAVDAAHRRPHLGPEALAQRIGRLFAGV